MEARIIKNRGFVRPLKNGDEAIYLLEFRSDNLRPFWFWTIGKDSKGFFVQKWLKFYELISESSLQGNQKIYFLKRFASYEKAVAYCEKTFKACNALGLGWGVAKSFIESNKKY